MPIGSALNRLLYAIKYRQLNILLSGAIDGNSKIMYIRDPLSRVAKVAPFLTLDGDPYPVVIDGGKRPAGWWTATPPRTTTRTRSGSACTRRRPTATAPAGRRAGQVNYIRNSVKAVVNAYTGAVTLYQWSDNGPGASHLEEGVPRRHQAGPSDIPAASWRTCATPRCCSRRSGRSWPSTTSSRPRNSTAGRISGPCPSTRAAPARKASSQPPYYLTMTMPGYRQPVFSLTTSFTPRGRANMAAFMAVDSNPGPGYGTIRLLQLPQDTAIQGPGAGAERLRVQSRVASALTLLRQGGSKVTQGNLITLPVGGGLVYFEPVYVSQSSAGSLGARIPPCSGCSCTTTARSATRIRCRPRWPRFSPAVPSPGAGQAGARPGRRRREGQRGGAEGPAAGGEVLRPGAAGAEERRPRCLRPGHRQGEGGTGQGKASGGSSPAAAKRPSATPSPSASPAG